MQKYVTLKIQIIFSYSFYGILLHQNVVFVAKIKVTLHLKWEYYISWEQIIRN